MATTPTSPTFVLSSQLPWETVGEGVTRQVLTHEASLMLVRVRFAAGAVGALHQHRHTQLTYVESGVFRCTVGEQERQLRAGDSFYAPSNVWHGVVCEEAGSLVDAFSPMREDFV